MNFESLENRRLLCSNPNFPFEPSGTVGDTSPDFYYTPDTGALVMDTDDVWMQSIVVDGDQPLQVDFLPQSWTTAFFNGSQQWFLAPLETPWNGAARMATYATGLDATADFPCVETSINFDGDPNSISTIAQMDVAIDDIRPQTSQVVSASVTRFSNPMTYTFNVTYTDNVFVDLDTVSNADYQVNGPNYVQLATLVTAIQNTDGSIEATYRVPANGGTWGPEDNGSYSIETVAGEIADLGGNEQLGGVTVGTFGVNYDFVDPTAVLISAPSIIDDMGVDSPQEITVEYQDDIAVDVSDIGHDDIEVIAPNGNVLLATLSSVSSSVDSSPVRAVYHLEGPGGDWSPVVDDGTYVIRMVENQVSDTGENPVTNGVLGSFLVDVDDIVVPEVSLTTATDIGPSPTATAQEILVAYTDNVALDASSLGPGDLEVVNPNGNILLPDYESQSTNVDSMEINASYRLDAPDGSWEAKDNGLYQIRTRNNQVLDTSGNSLQMSVIGTFTVDVVDTTRPSVVATATDIIAPTSESQIIEVVYSDDVAVDASDIGNGDIQVIPPSGSPNYTATFLSRSTDLDGTPISASYELTAPGGIWNISDNGRYRIRIVAGQVSDTSGNLAAQGIVGQFDVNVPNIAPMGSAEAADISITSTTVQTITVTYTDDVAIDASTIGALDIEVNVPGLGAVPVNPVFVSKSSSNDVMSIDATYAMAPLGGVWDASDNGTYEIFTRPNEVLDSAGQPAEAIQIGSFEVGISDDLFVDQEVTLGSLTHNDEVDLADLDGDGDLDAFVTARDASEEIWINDGTGTFTLSPQDLGNDDSIYSALGDIDGDGDMDAVVAAVNEVVIWRNDGNANFISTTRIPTQFALDVGLADLNNDGDLDLFVVQNDFQPDLVFFNDGAGNLFFSGQQFAGLSSKSIEFADIDGDDDLDAIIGVQSGANNGNLVLLNDGNGFFSDSLQPIGTDSDQHVAVGDIDGDGDLDLVGTSGSIFLNDGLGQFSQSTESIPYLVTSHVILEDFDSDGDLDVFQVNWSNNPDKVYLNNGFGEFTDSGLSLGAEFSSHAAAGDIDNDGDLDVVIASARPNQPNRVWFNNSLASQNPYDFDHDGDVNGDDIDMLCVAVREGSTNAILDIDGNGLIESPDFSLYLDILGTKLGDANLDGVVDVSDFAIWNANKFTSNEPLLSHVGWSTADFNCDGVTDVSDFSIWNANKFSVALRIAGETNSNEETAQKAELNRTYQIRVKADEVSDTSGNALPNSIIGTFQVSVARDYDGDGNTPWEFEPTQSQEHSTNRDSQTEDSMELALIDRVFETTGN